MAYGIDMLGNADMLNNLDFTSSLNLAPQTLEMGNLGANASGALADQNMWGGFTNGMKDFGGALMSKQGQGMLGLGIQGFGAMNNYNMGNNQMDIANQQLAMQKDAYATDKANAEARKNLRF